MDRFVSVLVMVILIIALLISAGLFSDTLSTALRRRVPRLAFAGDTLIIWGLLVIAAFALGLTVMYLLLRF